MTCPGCQRINRPGRRFCAECGARLGLRCPACGFSNEPDERFCGGCGQALAPAAGGTVPPQSYTPSHLAERILVSRDALQGERKQVTVLFADLKGSMELLAERDPEEARRVLDPVLERMIEAVHRYEGTVNQILGDGIMALFGAPLAHEDHAVRACFAALRMQQTVRRYAAGAAEGVPLEIRVGLNAGDVIVRSIGNDLHMEYSAIGQTTHLAARMEQLAFPGTILMTSHVLALAEGYVHVTSRGLVPVKGMPAPVEVFELTGAEDAHSRLETAAARGLTPFVGREYELQQLQAARQQAGTGHGQVVAILGEPGVGKSRLIREFLRSSRDERRMVLEASCLPYERGAPYAPVIRLLKSYFGIAGSDQPSTIGARVREVLARDDSHRFATPLLALLDVPVADDAWEALDPAQRRRQTLEAICGLLLRRSEIQPVCVVAEDLHWMDTESQAFLDGLIERLPTARVLLLVTYRPEYQHGWANRTGYRQIRIDSLSTPSVEELLTFLLGPSQDLQPLTDLLIERTQGNPFFLEESVRNLVEIGVLTGVRGAYRLSRPPEGLPVPDTVQAVLAARIDRLPPDHKRVLQAASALGKDVPLALLRPVVDRPEEELDHILRQLQAGEMLHEARLYPEIEYTFRHALTLDVTYGGLVRDRRRELDARIVAAIEQRYAGRPAEQLDRLAHHSFRGEVWTKALEYCREAAARAFARSAHVEALHHVDQALEALGHLSDAPPRTTLELELLTQRGAALRALRGYAAPEVERVYLEARRLCRDVGDAPQRFTFEWQQMQFFLVRGDLATAGELATSLLEAAQRRQERPLLMDAHLANGMTLFHLGDFTGARDHLVRGLALAQPDADGPHLFTHGQDTGVFLLSYLGWTLWFLGYPDDARARVERAVDIARQKGHAFSQVSALTFAARVFQCRRDLAKLRLVAGELIAAAQQRGFAYYEALGLIQGGWARVLMDGDEAGHAQLLEGYTALEKTGTVLGLRGALVQLAEAAQHLGRADEARGAVERAEMDAQGRGTHCWDAEIARLRAELAGEPPDPDGRPNPLYARALQTARRQGARSLELRAALSYARSIRAPGHREQARQLVRAIAEAFTEGASTVELREARDFVKG